MMYTKEMVNRISKRITTPVIKFGQTNPKETRYSLLKSITMPDLKKKTAKKMLKKM